MSVLAWVRSSVVEHGIADPRVTGSNPVVPSFFYYYYFFFQIIKPKQKKKVLPGFEPGLLDSKSRVITVTPQNPSLCVCFVFAQCGDRTHDLKIMRLTRYQLRQLSRLQYLYTCRVIKWAMV